ncbi:MAG: stage III sporulation protein AF [Pseudoflavonifractor sp.]|nr:stage III sporulation protein AF [Pseudoflavonifractor sp.]
MTFLKEWLMGVVAAALGVALAQALTPEGTVKKVGRLVGGLVLLLAVIGPLGRLDPEDLAVTAAAYADIDQEEAEQGSEEVMKTLIAQKSGAYIEDKGTALGCVCTAAVEVQKDDSGWPVPWSVQIRGSWTAEQKKALSRTVAEDLAIPAERQNFQEEVP